MSIPSEQIISWDDDTYVGVGDTFDSWRKKTNGIKSDLTTRIDNHVTDGSGSHQASSISFNSSGGIASQDVQAAIEELDTEKASKITVDKIDTGLTDHVESTQGAHKASAISFDPSGEESLTANNVQDVVLELAPKKDPSFTGTVTLFKDPVLDLEAATKQYVDNFGPYDYSFKASIDLTSGATMRSLNLNNAIDNPHIEGAEHDLAWTRTLISADDETDHIFYEKFASWYRYTVQYSTSYPVVFEHYQLLEKGHWVPLQQGTTEALCVNIAPSTLGYIFSNDPNTGNLFIDVPHEVRSTALPETIGTTVGGYNANYTFESPNKVTTTSSGTILAWEMSKDISSRGLIVFPRIRTNVFSLAQVCFLNLLEDYRLPSEEIDRLILNITPIIADGVYYSGATDGGRTSRSYSLASLFDLMTNNYSAWNSTGQTGRAKDLNDAVTSGNIVASATPTRAGNVLTLTPFEKNNPFWSLDLANKKIEAANNAGTSGIYYNTLCYTGDLLKEFKYTDKCIPILANVFARNLISIDHIKLASTLPVFPPSDYEYIEYVSYGDFAFDADTRITANDLDLEDTSVKILKLSSAVTETNDIVSTRTLKQGASIAITSFSTVVRRDSYPYQPALTAQDLIGKTITQVSEINVTAITNPHVLNSARGSTLYIGGTTEAQGVTLAGSVVGIDSATTKIYYDPNSNLIAASALVDVLPSSTRVSHVLSSINRSSTVTPTVTVSSDNELGYTAGLNVNIQGSTTSAFNGIKKIVSSTVNSFTFNLPTFNITSGGSIKTVVNISSLTWSSTNSLATATCSLDHGLRTGMRVWITGATPTAFNGIVQITVTGLKTFTYSVSSPGATSATGTITARYIQITTTSAHGFSNNDSVVVEGLGTGGNTTATGALIETNSSNVFTYAIGNTTALSTPTATHVIFKNIVATDTNSNLTSTLEETYSPNTISLGASNSGGTGFKKVTVTPAANQGYTVNSFVTISGSSISDYNGDKKLTGIGTTFSFNVLNTVTSVPTTFNVKLKSLRITAGAVDGSRVSNENARGLISGIDGNVIVYEPVQDGSNAIQSLNNSSTTYVKISDSSGNVLYYQGLHYAANAVTNHNPDFIGTVKSRQNDAKTKIFFNITAGTPKSSGYIIVKNNSSLVVCKKYSSIADYSLSELLVYNDGINRDFVDDEIFFAYEKTYLNAVKGCDNAELVFNYSNENYYVNVSKPKPIFNKNKFIKTGYKLKYDSTRYPIVFCLGNSGGGPVGTWNYGTTNNVKFILVTKNPTTNTRTIRRVETSFKAQGNQSRLYWLNNTFYIAVPKNSTDGLKGFIPSNLNSYTTVTSLTATQTIGAGQRFEISTNGQVQGSGYNRTALVKSYRKIGSGSWATTNASIT